MPAFLAGMVVVLSHVPLGQEVVKRGIIFIDLAIAQIAGVGVIAAKMLDIETDWGVQLFAAGAALSGALLLTLTEKVFGQLQEPLIGVLFILAATLGLVLLAHDPHGGEALKDMLSGQILWVTTQQILTSSGILLLTTALWLLLKKRNGHACFYPLFAIAITTSVQLVGVYLVFASLIIPALATLALRRHALLTGYVIGIAGYGAGLMASLQWDISASPLIVWCLAITAAVFAAIRFTTVDTELTPATKK